MSNNQWIDVTPEDVEEIIKSKKDIQLIDVREVDEYNEGHIPGVKLVPLSQLDVRTEDIDKNKEAVIICRSGGRSRLACEYLTTLGFTKLKNMTGGMLAWEGDTEV